ncbi:hypothetical protein P9578_06330 [Brevibacillus choshinensis]|uniref:hypothetical protein n=1 Tax=Brevibacillus choshinensis TaxID=54911 RepID=UPI002E1AF153|nr:hypothetical protein [Brevibacillus choshinensis]MED4781087.1 hypothetical protein [Brevibacillus choshinensis]
MKWGGILGISFIVAMMTWYEWSSLRVSHWKTKVAYTTLLVTGWVIAILLIHNPYLPGATQVFMKMYDPISTFLKTK